MNRRRIGLGAAIVGVGVLVGRRMRTQADPGANTDGTTVSHHSDSAVSDKPTTASPAVPAVAAADPVDAVVDAGSMNLGIGSPVVAQASLSDSDIGSPDISDKGVAADLVGAAPDSAIAGVAAPAAASSLGDLGPPPSVVLPTMPSAGTRPFDSPPGQGDSDTDESVFVWTPQPRTDSTVGSDAATIVGSAVQTQAAQLEPLTATSSTPEPDTLGSDPVPAPPSLAPNGAFAPTSDAANTSPAVSTLSGYVPAVDVDPPKPPRFKRRGWRIFGGLLFGLLVAAFIAASAVRLPYYSVSPGSVYDTIERVEAPGELVSIPTGEIGFVTVAQTANITPWQWLDAKLDSNIKIQHEDEVQGNQTADELREADLRRMTVSKNDAVIVALQRLGYDLEITELGIEVAQVFDCTAADGTLGTGDLIVAVDGVDVRNGQQLVEQLGTHGIGDDIELLIERIDPNNPTQSMRTDLVGLTLGSADAECLPDDIRAAEPRPFIGIGTLPLTDENFPIDVDVRTGRVSGPSAGLAFTLAIMDVLSEGELTNGLSIVATGTINRDGVVGPVGGIQQKTVAAERSGADLFLVPLCCDNFVDVNTGEPLDLPSNYEEALLYADDMVVVGVSNLDEALAAIGAAGGDVEQFLG